MVNPMRNTLKRGLSKKGVVETKERFVKLSYPLLESEALRWLKPQSEAVYIELRRRYNGSNNGTIALSMGGAAKRLKASKSTIQKALQELEEHGFIKRVRCGYFTGRKASEYALTDERLDGHLPTNEWKCWRPMTLHRRRQIRAIGTETILKDIREERPSTIKL